MLIQAECLIPAPKSKCFTAFSDLNRLSEFVTAITKIEILTPGEIGVGTKFKESRVMFGKESSEIMEITLFDIDSHIREEAHASGVHYISDWTFSESNGQTKVHITFNIKAKTLLAKLMMPMFYCLASSLRKAFITDMEDMKKAILKQES